MADTLESGLHRLAKGVDPTKLSNHALVVELLWARQWARSALAKLPPTAVVVAAMPDIPFSDADKRAVVTGSSKGEKARGMFG
jgi:hypothetical protein